AVRHGPARVASPITAVVPHAGKVVRLAVARGSGVRPNVAGADERADHGLRHAATGVRVHAPGRVVGVGARRGGEVDGAVRSTARDEDHELGGVRRQRLVHVVLLDVRQDRGTPPPVRVVVVELTDGELLVDVVIVLKAQTELLEVVLALHTGGR